MHWIIVLAIVLIVLYQFNHKLIGVADADEVALGTIALNLIKI